ncbi:hypothetical protein E1A91_D06G026200v1 [Gossypium mustelinum]|uniref:Small EDRK-rich factor-like N-terminal domain-containing protein n=1 Tax=Gossypium mustelinum TaxID=34275 RepID=A0A5D2UGC5_GOSMU|nr:hypothetical protein E1A91_D06G026200v1 [Gossypium mustelinum]
MGGGNGQKSRMAREKHMEKNKPTKGSQLESNKEAMTIQCKVCMHVVQGLHADIHMHHIRGEVQGTC